MSEMAGVFKQYDIRGIFGDEVTEELAYKIGRAFVTFLGCASVVVGRDMRNSSDMLCIALSKGITDQGANVIDIGLVTTPVLYYAARDAEAAIMITASHNPPEFNGFKLCRQDAVPLSGASGIQNIERLVEKKKFAEPAAKGNVKKIDVVDNYIDHILGFAEGISEVKIVIDTANAVAGLTIPKLLTRLNCDFVHLYPELDGTFPNHEADPLKPKNTEDLRKEVVKQNAQLGVAFDGDADRCIFIDERGETISADMITALISSKLLKERPGETILYDLRSSWAVKEEIEKAGGRPVQCRVGHSFIKTQMREENALFAGELSGHFYFRDNGFVESSELAVVSVLSILSLTKQPLSSIIQPIQRYFASGEINFQVADKETVLKRLEDKYGNGRAYHLDGLSVEFDDWWFNVRPSNTEPFLRLNLEAKNKELMVQKKEELERIISS
jgi:phosphomannomutase